MLVRFAGGLHTPIPKANSKYKALINVLRSSIISILQGQSVGSTFGPENMVIEWVVAYFPLRVIKSRTPEE